MRLVTMIRQRLALKIFLSHLVIIVVGVAVLSGTALIQAPIALDRHIVEMRALTGDNPTLVTGLIVVYGYACEAFFGWYSGNEYERFMLKNRSGPMIFPPIMDWIWFSVYFISCKNLNYKYQIAIPK